jgi:F0F1-type ATP synthase assembly protein I
MKNEKTKKRKNEKTKKRKNEKTKKRKNEKTKKRKNEKTKLSGATFSFEWNCLSFLLVLFSCILYFISHTQIICKMEELAG